jgi:two-component system CheB/CheR fusion protein
MYGYTEAEALGMNISEIVPKEERQASRQLIERIQSGEKVRSLEAKRVTKDGRILTVWLTVTRLADAQGTVTSVATTERDITERIGSLAARE